LEENKIEKIRGDILNRKAFAIDCQRNSFADTPTTYTSTDWTKERKKKRRKEITQKYV